MPGRRSVTPASRSQRGRGCDPSGARRAARGVRAEPRGGSRCAAGQSTVTIFYQGGGCPRLTRSPGAVRPEPPRPLVVCRTDRCARLRVDLVGSGRREGSRTVPVDEVASRSDGGRCRARGRDVPARSRRGGRRGSSARPGASPRSPRPARSPGSARRSRRPPGPSRRSCSGACRT